MTDSNGGWVQCLGVAACLAKRAVWWFSTDQFGAGFHGLRAKRWWVVMVNERAPLRYLVEFPRIRHPSSCWPQPRRGEKKFAPSIRKYDWRPYLDHPNLPLGVATPEGATEP